MESKDNRTSIKEDTILNLGGGGMNWASAKLAVTEVTVKDFFGVGHLTQLASPLLSSWESNHHIIERRLDLMNLINSLSFEYNNRGVMVGMGLKDS